MQVHEAVASRLSVRAFLPDLVPRDVIRRVLERAARAPSGGNVQPWHIDVLGGQALTDFKAKVQSSMASGVPEPMEYDIYPKGLTSPWRERRFGVGEAMYATLGIPRDDKPARLRWLANNYAFFGAPLALFCSVDRQMGPPQWSDLGMYLQTVMLLLREEGLDSCAQECWARFPQTVRDTLELPPERMLFCGMAIGKRDPSHAVNSLAADRAPLEETVRYFGI